MATSQKIRKNNEELTSLLMTCRENRVIFEAQDEQHNLFSLGFEEILHTTNHHIVTYFKPLHTGSSELRLNWEYTFSFQDQDKTYAFEGILVDGDPRSFKLTFKLRNETFRLESRRSRRVPIENPDRVSAEIDGQVFKVLNLSVGGVGILVQHQNQLQIGQDLAFTLLYKQRFFQATGNIKHIGPLSGDGFICGIALTYHNEASIGHIQRFIQETHQKRKKTSLLNLLHR